MKIYESLFKATGLKQLDISKELQVTQPNVSKTQRNTAWSKRLSIAMTKLNINKIEAEENGLKVTIERL
jgi:hypothetical protein